MIIICLGLAGQKGQKRYEPILDWQQTMIKLPWGVILLLGGGFALAAASKVIHESHMFVVVFWVFVTFSDISAIW